MFKKAKLYVGPPRGMNGPVNDPNKFVAEVEVPNFSSDYPELVFWGWRVFRHVCDDVYNEASCYFVPLDPPPEAKP